MLKTDARAERQQRVSRLSRDAFADHEIREESEGRWVLQRRHADGGWRSEFWVEVIALRGRGLLVDGDIDPVVFRYGPESAEARVRWMGERRGAHDRYVREKAAIGLGISLERWDRDVAHTDLRALELELRVDEEDDEDERAGRHAAVVAEARAYIEDQHEVGRILYEGGVDPELVDRVGMVVTSRLYYAHAALARLCSLLDDRDGGDGEARDA